VSSGERKRNRLNRVRVIPGRGCVPGVVGPFSQCCRAGRESKSVVVSGRFQERAGTEGDTPVHENATLPNGIPSSSEPVKFAVNLAGPPAKPKYSLVTDSGLVP
jgi:hypothetical protein